MEKKRHITIKKSSIEKEKRCKLEQKYHLIHRSLRYNRKFDSLIPSLQRENLKANYQDFALSGHILQEMVCD